MDGENPLLQTPFFKAMIAKQQGGGQEGEAPSAPSAVPAPERRIQATAVTSEPPADTTDYGGMGWGEVAQKGISAAPQSFKKAIGAMGEAITHPTETISGLGQLGTGFASKARGWAGAEQNAAQKARDEQALDAITKHYQDVYGGLTSGDTAGLKKELATDPFSVGMDVASLMPVGGAALRGVGLGEKAASLATKAGVLMDPIQASLAAAKTVVGKPSEYIGKTILSKTSGVPKFALDVSENLGQKKYATAADAAAAKAAYNSGATAENIADTFENAFGELKDLASAEYKQRHGGIPNTAVPVNTIQQSIDGIVSQMGGDAVAKQLFPQEYGIIDRMRQSLAVKPTWTAPELDLLKKSFDDDVGLLSRAGSKFRGAFAEAPRSVIDAIGTVHPEYANMLRQWQGWLEKARNLQQNFGKAGKSSDATIMNKLLKGTKTPNGQNLISELKKTKAGKFLPEMLAGYATKEWLPGMGTGIQDMIAAGLIYGSGLGFTPHMLAGAAAASPKIAGASMRGLGAMKGLGEKVSPAFRAPSTAIINQLNEAGIPQPTAMEGQQESTGGRIGRQTGGRVGNPGADADRLIMAAEKSKKQHGKRTSPLLNVPDEAISKALSVANENI